MTPRTPEHNAKISAALKGRVPSPEARAKMQANHHRMGSRPCVINCTCRKHDYVPRGVTKNLLGLMLNGRAQVRMVTGWILRSHAVWVAANGPIPAPGLYNPHTKTGLYVVYHEDEDKLNDSLDNLRLMTIYEHMRHHGLAQNRR